MAYMDNPRTPDQKRFYRYCLRQVRKDKAWAKKTQHDKKWLANASDMSKEILQKRLTKSVNELAIDKYRYLKMRAFANQSGYIIDPSAKRLWEKVTGHKIPRKESHFKYKR